MSRKPKPKPPTKGVILPPELDDDADDEIAGGGIPDDDGWIHLEGEEPTDGKEKPKRKSARRPS